MTYLTEVDTESHCRSRAQTLGLSYYSQLWDAVARMTLGTLRGVAHVFGEEQRCFHPTPVLEIRLVAEPFPEEARPLPASLCTLGGPASAQTSSIRPLAFLLTKLL